MRLRSALARVATLVAALPLSLGLAGTAQAQTVEVPGCYGVLIVYCDPAIEIALPVGLQPYTTVIPVCAGTCMDIPVTAYTVTFPSNPQICLKTEDRNGNQSRSCVPLAVGPIGLPYVDSCGYDETGVVIRNSDGSTLWNLCFGDVLADYRIENCYYQNEVGFRIVDRYGYERYNFCFAVQLEQYNVEVCQYPYIGVVVYDSWGNQVAGRCVRIREINVPTLEELCQTVHPALYCGNIT